MMRFLLRWTIPTVVGLTLISAGPGASGKALKPNRHRSAAGVALPPDPAHRSAAAAERSAAAAERSALNSGRSADASASSADTAHEGLLTSRFAAVLSFLALLGPYFVLLINHVNDEKKKKSRQDALDASGRRMIDDTCNAVLAAVESHNGQNTTRGELWRDLSRLSALRNVIKVYLEAGAASHEVLLGLSEAFQINFATRDALIMRDPAGAGGAPTASPNIAGSDAVLGDVKKRVEALRSTLNESPLP